MCHCFVFKGLLFSAWVFNHSLFAAPFYQRLQLVTAGRHSLTLLQKALKEAAEDELKGQPINLTSENQFMLKVNHSEKAVAVYCICDSGGALITGRLLRLRLGLESKNSKHKVCVTNWRHCGQDLSD